jgi:hypothetical protein
VNTDYWSSPHCPTTVWPRFLYEVRDQLHSSGECGAKCRQGIREVAKQLTGLCPRVVATDRELAVSRQTNYLPNFRILAGSPEGDPLPVRRRTDLRTTGVAQFAYQPPPLAWLTILMATQSTPRGVDPAGTHNGSACFHGLHPCLKTLPVRPSLGRLRLGLVELSASCIAAFTASTNPTSRFTPRPAGFIYASLPRFAPRPAGFTCSLSSHYAVSTDPERDEVRRPFVTAATPFTKTCEMPSG